MGPPPDLTRLGAHRAGQGPPARISPLHQAGQRGEEARCSLGKAELDVAHLQRREEHWAIVDLVGKGRHIRTVPVPDWVKAANAFKTHSTTGSAKPRPDYRIGRTFRHGLHIDRFAELLSRRLTARFGTVSHDEELRDSTTSFDMSGVTLASCAISMLAMSNAGTSIVGSSNCSPSLHPCRLQMSLEVVW